MREKGEDEEKDADDAHDDELRGTDDEQRAGRS